MVRLNKVLCALVMAKVACLGFGCRGGSKGGNSGEGYVIHFVDSALSVHDTAAVTEYQEAVSPTLATRWQSFRPQSFQLPVSRISLQSEGSYASEEGLGQPRNRALGEPNNRLVVFDCVAANDQACAKEHAGSIERFSIGFNTIPEHGVEAVVVQRCQIRGDDTDMSDVNTFQASISAVVSIGPSTVATSKNGLSEAALPEAFSFDNGHCEEVLPIVPAVDLKKNGITTLFAYYDSSFAAHVFLPHASNMDRHFDTGPRGAPGYCGKYLGLGSPFICGRLPPFVMTTYSGKVVYQRYLLGSQKNEPSAVMGLYFSEEEHFIGGFLAQVFMSGRARSASFPTDLRIVGLNINDDQETFELVGSSAIDGKRRDFIIPFFPLIEPGSEFSAKYTDQFSGAPKDLWVRRLN